MAVEIVSTAAHNGTKNRIRKYLQPFQWVFSPRDMGPSLVSNNASPQNIYSKHKRMSSIDRSAAIQQTDTAVEAQHSQLSRGSMLKQNYFKEF